MPILGLATVIYPASDLSRAKAWYAKAFGKEPYFDQPFYVGFNVGGYELGLQPDPGAAGERADGAVAYWGVTDAHAVFNNLIELGATIHEPVQDVGEGIKVGTVKDPFGNVFGIIENPHFKLEK